MEVYVLNDECPVCGSGPLSYVRCQSGIYIRCVECACYWAMGGEKQFEKPIFSMNEDEKRGMRPATLEEIKGAKSDADLAGRWSYNNGFMPLL